MKNKISLYLSTVLLFSSVAYANYWSEPSQNIIKTKEEKTQKHITVGGKQLNILGFQLNNPTEFHGSSMDLLKDLYKNHAVNTIKLGFSFAKYDDLQYFDAKKDYITNAVEYVKEENKLAETDLKVIIELNVDPCAKDYTDGLLDSFKGCYQNSLDDFWEKRDGKYGKPSSYDRYLEFVSAVVEANKEESIVIGYNIMSAPGKTTADMDALLYLLTNKDARKDFPLLDNKLVVLAGEVIKKSVNTVTNAIYYQYAMYKKETWKWFWPSVRKAWHYGAYSTLKIGVWAASNKTILDLVLFMHRATDNSIGKNDSKITKFISDYTGPIASLMLNAKPTTGDQGIDTYSYPYGSKGLTYLEEFESKKLTNFYKKAIKKIQAIDKSKWIFIAPNQVANSFGIGTKLEIKGLKEIGKEKLAYMPKLSQLSTALFNGFDYFSDHVKIENSNFSRIINRLLNVFADKITIDLFKQSKFDKFFKNWIKRQAKLELPVVLGGFGGNIKPFAKPLGDDMDAPENIFTRLSGKYLSRIMKLSKESNIGTIYQVDTKFFTTNEHKLHNDESNLKKYPKMSALTPTTISVVSVDGDIKNEKYDARKQKYTLKYKVEKGKTGDVTFFIPTSFVVEDNRFYYKLLYGDKRKVWVNAEFTSNIHTTTFSKFIEKSGLYTLIITNKLVNSLKK